MGWYFAKHLFLGPFWLQFGGPSPPPDILSFYQFFKVNCHWIFWRGKVLELGLKEFKSLSKMSTPHKKFFFWSILAQFWGFWTALAYSYLVHHHRESTNGFSNVKSLKRRPRRVKGLHLKYILQRKTCFRVHLGCILGVLRPLTSSHLIHFSRQSAPGSFHVIKF